jgi:predicted nucleic acid-binding protein
MGELGNMIVDTDILIDYLRGKEKAAKLIDRYKQTESIETTDINVFELYHGAYKVSGSTKKVSKLKGFLNKIRVHSTSEDSMEMAGKLAAELEKDGEKIGAKDVLVSSIALVENKKVLTRNKKHFRKIDDLEIVEKEE